MSLGILSAPCLQIGALAQAPSASSPALPPEKGLTAWAGLTVLALQFEGVSRRIAHSSAGRAGAAGRRSAGSGKVRDSLRSLYATGLYQTIEVAGVRPGDNVTLVFSGVPTPFVGRVNMEGVKDDRLDAVLDSATQLQAGNRLHRRQSYSRHEPAIKAALENNGYYRARSPKPRSSIARTR